MLKGLEDKLKSYDQMQGEMTNIAAQEINDKVMQVVDKKLQDSQVEKKLDDAMKRSYIAIEQAEAKLIDTINRYLDSW